MPNRTSSLTIIAILLLSGDFARAGMIVDFDFEGANDPGTVFGFSQSGNVTIARTANSPNGNAGTEGAEFTIDSQSAAASFAGAGIGFFDLAVDSRFVAAPITVADLDLLELEFDAEVVGRDVSTLRIEASDGSFVNRVDIMPTLSGSFQTYSVLGSSLNNVQKANLAAHLNSINSTQLQFTFSFVDDGAGIFEVGNAVRIDNFSMIASVPEPSHLMLLGVGTIGFFSRRRRHWN